MDDQAFFFTYREAFCLLGKHSTICDVKEEFQRDMAFIHAQSLIALMERS